MNVRNWSIALLATGLCTVGRGQDVSRYLERPLPNQLTTNRGQWAADSGETAFNTQLSEWWKRFGDPLLDSLVEVASTQSFHVLTAIDRMEMARANLRMARSGLFPAVSLDAGWARQQTSGNAGGMSRSIGSAYSAGLNATWEIDLFGSIRRRVKAERESFYASRDEVEAVRVSLCAQVASAYVSLREMQQEMEVVRRNCAIQEKVLAMTEARYKAGLVSKLDVSQARSVYYSTKAGLPQMQADIDRQVASVAILLGTYPQEMRPVLGRTGRLPDYMEPVATEIPADLLLNRPDVRQGYRQVEAQAASLGASKADLFPQIGLKASAGYSSHKLKDLTRRNSMTFEIAPTLTWTLFDGTKLVNATRLARAQWDEAVHQFNQTVLNAVQEADNALASYRYSIRQVVEMREVCNQGKETLSLSIDLYKQGLTPFQNVLDALRSLLQYEDQLVQAQGGSLLNLISLYQAFGGGIIANY